MALSLDAAAYMGMVGSGRLKRPAFGSCGRPIFFGQACFAEAKTPVALMSGFGVAWPTGASISDVSIYFAAGGASMRTRRANPSCSRIAPLRRPWRRASRLAPLFP